MCFIVIYFVYSRGDEKNVTRKPQFYGPAYNCGDLEKLGYTLNGYYLVNNYENATNRKRDVVLCRFKQSRSGNQGKKTIDLHNY